MSALDPSALLSLLPSLLPQDAKRLASPTDALAVLFHTIMSALEFRLVAIDDDSLPTHAESNVLPAEWAAHPGNHTFRYKHTQSSLEFVLKVVRLANRTVVNAITSEVCIPQDSRSLIAHASCRPTKSPVSISRRRTLPARPSSLTTSLPPIRSCMDTFRPPASRISHPASRRRSSRGSSPG